MQQTPYVIGVAGGTGSGKTTLANNLLDAFTDEALILSHDYYYLPHDDMTLEERQKLNYDHPNAFETDLMIRDVQKLRSFEPIDRPQYSFVEHTRLTETVHVEPKPLVILEGILLFENQALLDLMDIKVYVDTDADIRLIRRLLRDVKERGRSLDSVINQYMNTVKPMHEQFVEPSKKNADIIIPEGGQNQVALQMLIDRLDAMLHRGPGVQ
ncbi:uridine kinase [Caproicibacterium amylolyticum]|jgi:uridine kinase|uniref:Uridine kinase n=1 Tax=Caproicibacterium amylolyticum TaxID=2766537 RepID=A0A7G9WFL9_9FIRM|nr:uridine kinase [Caproicibacterium amylolyticum]MBE6721999.1 uridine kinase [Oscillospiraceae bacterium]QNO17481.1 uridine kinase [Caproicibacterium amylolyticum]